MDLISKRGSEIFETYTVMLEKMRNSLKELKILRLAETESYDKSKLVISVKGTGISGRQFYEKLLNQYHLQLEMAAGSYVLAMTSVGDTQEGMSRLTSALKEMDFLLDKKMTEFEPKAGEQGKSKVNFSLPKLRKIYTSAEVDDLLNHSSGSKVISLQWQNAEGWISTEYAYVYPPGTPLVVPGEEISREAAELICKYEALGFSVEGPERKGRIEVLANG
jgi:arginine/lysine/ornithine decarboxylase